MSDATLGGPILRPGVVPPPRLTRPSAGMFALYVAAGGFFLFSLHGSDISVRSFIEGLPNMARLVGEMFPPSLARIQSVGISMLETFQMAFAGTVIGVILSVPLAILAARSLTPHVGLYYVARWLIALFRTVPDLVWALFFVVTVGLGPFAGMLTLVVDAIGFCGRFFAEAMEETDKGPQEALTALGARKSGIVFSAVLPAAMPSMINSALFTLEKATRASVVLGLVGAGGIGIELKVAMDLFQYDQAATIIIGVFLLVLVVERLSSMLRQRILRQST
ncbi:phosphonate ABC transporter, permease protein PhnE [Dongia mobilis]|uniref:phosphonate ABC transporter, permease protein PhnE n=1 Tax=Dongia sp. TaxID=1977262 RepID=UPI0026ECA9FD